MPRAALCDSCAKYIIEGMDVACTISSTIEVTSHEGNLGLPRKRTSTVDVVDFEEQHHISIQTNGHLFSAACDLLKRP